MSLPAQRLMRVSASASVLGLCLIWVRAGAAPWMNQRLTEAVQVEVPAPQLLVDSKWADEAARIAARRLLAEGLRAREAEAELLLDHSVRARPLYAPTWLARAQLAVWQGRLDQADAYASVSTLLWPNRDRLLWRVAMLRIAMGDRDGAFRALRAHQRGRTSGMERVVWIAERIEPDSERLIAQLMPEREWARSEADSYLAQLLGVAAYNGQISLMRRAWGGLSDAARAKPETARTHVDALISAGLVEQAISVWRRYGSRSTGRPLTNPSFEEAPAQGGLGWRVWATKGVEWARDREVRRDGAYSLRLSFDGSENLAYRHAFQLVPVEPGRIYRLRGQWRGANITTTSGPYLEVASRDEDGRLRVKGRARVGSWEWMGFELEFRVPSDNRLVELRVRRDREEGLPRGISGTLWLDDLALVPVGNGALDG